MTTPSPTPRRRWYQFSLRTLLIGVLVLSLPLSWFACRMQRAKRQRAAVEAFHAAMPWADVFYDYEVKRNEPPGPVWFRELVGRDFLSDVVAVKLGSEKGGHWGEFVGPFDRLESLTMCDEVTDADLRHLRNSTRLREIACYTFLNRHVSDTGLAYLEGLNELEVLLLGDLGDVTDGGMAHIAALVKLRELSLWGSQVTDSGVMQLSGLKNLQYLDLAGTQVTDAGLEHLEGLPNLTHLDLGNTHVTPEGVKKLQEALPNCKIVY